MNTRERSRAAAPISVGVPRRILKARKKRDKVRTAADVRVYVFGRERNVCRCCRKRRAESMHELKFRSQGGKVSKKNSIACCGDGVRGCHGFLQRHEIEYYAGPNGAEATLTFFMPKPCPSAADWLGIESHESIESAPMLEYEVAE